VWNDCQGAVGKMNVNLLFWEHFQENFYEIKFIPAFLGAFSGKFL